MPSVTTATLVGGLPFASVHRPVTHNGILLNCCAVDVDSQWRRRVFMLVLSMLQGFKLSSLNGDMIILPLSISCIIDVSLNIILLN